VQIELRDESPQAAYFDDLLVRLIKQQRVQQHHYDPWGLPLAGLDTEPERSPEARQYNGQRHVQDLGLEWNFHDKRTLDNQIPRWWQADPAADVAGQESLSPYHFGANNPVRYSDPDGDCPVCPFIILAGLMLSSQPVIAPTQNATANQQAYARGQADYGVAVVSALMPARTEGKISQVLYQVSTNKAKQAVTTNLASRIENASPRVKKALESLGPSKSAGGTVHAKPNPLDPKNAQEVNMTVVDGAGKGSKVDFRIETHDLPAKLGGNGSGSPVRHMNVDYYEAGTPVRNALPNSGHKILTANE
jgi:RHS repeat-associated protein